MPSSCPIELYKYKDVSGDGIEHVEDMLHNNRVWFSSPLSFNDPFDCRYTYDVVNRREDIVLRKAAFENKRNGLSLSEALKKAENEIPFDPHELERWQKQQIDRHSRCAANTGIFCLTPVCDNFTMWTHYATCHTGICIQFRPRETQEEHINFIGDAQQVNYSDRCPLINFARDNAIDIARKAFLTKATPFRYELEWRIVKYDQGSGYKTLPQGIIGAVILGCQIETEVRERVLKACADYNGNVDIVRASLDPEVYGLSMQLEMTV